MCYEIFFAIDLWHLVCAKAEELELSFHCYNYYLVMVSKLTPVLTSGSKILHSITGMYASFLIIQQQIIKLETTFSEVVLDCKNYLQAGNVQLSF